MGRANVNGRSLGQSSTQVSVQRGYNSVADPITTPAEERLRVNQNPFLLSLTEHVHTQQRCERTDSSGGQEGLGGCSRRTARCALPKNRLGRGSNGSFAPFLTPPRVASEVRTSL